MLRTLLFLFSSLIASSVTARLWETESEIEARYSKPVEKSEDFLEQGKLYTYRFKGFLVMITFEDGKSQNEFYIHEDRKAPFTEKEIQFFLDLNSMGDQWHKDTNDPMWILGDRKALAAYYEHLGRSDTPGLSICTNDHAKRHGNFQ